MSDERYQHYESDFRLLVSPQARLETFFTECRWSEGPVWFDDGGYLLWSDIPNDRILRWMPGRGVDIFRSPSSQANGHTLDREGRLVSCSHLNRRVERTEHDGSITTLCDAHAGKRLNSPNDVVVKSDGSIWFTDPSYGIHSDPSLQEQAGCFVFRFDPASGDIAAVISDMDRPNGLCFSPDESILYVADSGVSEGPGRPHHIRAFKADAGNRLSGGEVLAVIDPGGPDGIRCDAQGNVWSTADDGIHILSPSGVTIGRIATPKCAANLTFGGPRMDWLFITATDSVHRLPTLTTGARRP